jgi:hypothetical protein
MDILKQKIGDMIGSREFWNWKDGYF